MTFKQKTKTENNANLQKLTQNTSPGSHIDKETQTHRIGLQANVQQQGTCGIEHNTTAEQLDKYIIYIIFKQTSSPQKQIAKKSRKIEKKKIKV